LKSSDMRRQDSYVRQELQKQFSEKHQVDMKFLKVPKVPWRAHCQVIK
jgi:hypothetical protein